MKRFTMTAIMMAVLCGTVMATLAEKVVATNRGVGQD
jgi:hypothetical protein